MEVSIIKKIQIQQHQELKPSWAQSSDAKSSRDECVFKIEATLDNGDSAFYVELLDGRVFDCELIDRWMRARIRIGCSSIDENQLE